MKFEGVFPTPGMAVNYVPFPIAGTGVCELSEAGLHLFGQRCRSSVAGLISIVGMFAVIGILVAARADFDSFAIRSAAVLGGLGIGLLAFRLFGTSGKAKEWDIPWSDCPGYFSVKHEKQIVFHITVKKTILYFAPKYREEFGRTFDRFLAAHRKLPGANLQPGQSGRPPIERSLRKALNEPEKCEAAWLEGAPGLFGGYRIVVALAGNTVKYIDVSDERKVPTLLNEIEIVCPHANIARECR